VGVTQGRIGNVHVAEILRLCAILTAGMDAPADFKTSVLASLDRLGNVRALGSREALLLGQTASGGWTRLRLPARYSWFEALMVRAFIKQKRLDRLAILVADEFDHGRPRRLRLECVDPARKQDEILEAPLVAMPGNSMQPGLWALRSEGTGGRLAKLARAARAEWSDAPAAPMRLLLGRPWLLTLLVFALSLGLVEHVLRIRWIVAGHYSWMPFVPPQAANIMYAADVVLIAATVVGLWRQSRLGYVLALTLAGVEFVRPIVIIIPVARSMTVSEVAVYLVLSWLFSALILVTFLALYLERRSRKLSEKLA
jgi:hypothetical protein